MSKYSENIRRNFEPSCYDLYFVTEYFSLNLVISIVQKYFINFESKVLREIQVFFKYPTQFPYLIKNSILIGQ